MTALTLSVPQPGWRYMPRYGDALVERREVRGYATASDLAKKSKEVAEQLQDPQLAAFNDPEYLAADYKNGSGWKAHGFNRGM